MKKLHTIDVRSKEVNGFIHFYMQSSKYPDCEASFLFVHEIVFREFKDRVIKLANEMAVFICEEAASSVGGMKPIVTKPGESN